MRRTALGLVLVACSQPSPARRVAPKTVTPIAQRMDTFEMNGYTLAGAEYWPYVGKEAFDEDHDILWGFYPVRGEIPPGEDVPNADSASPAAIACAEQAFAALQVFLASNPPALRQVVERGEAAGFVPRFYLWTNDYTRAAEPYPAGVREARLWYWHRKQPAPPKPPGYWKWESTLTQQGECLVPKQPQIDTYLAETLSKL